MKRLLLDTRGDAYAWAAALLLFVGLPLSSLSIDVVRMMYVRGHLHTAADAACQAAVDALDVPHFLETGRARIQPGLARVQAREVFLATLTDRATVRYTQGLRIAFPAPRFARCTATAHVARLIPLTPPMRVRVQTTSEMRMRNQNGN